MPNYQPNICNVSTFCVSVLRYCMGAGCYLNNGFQQIQHYKVSLCGQVSTDNSLLVQLCFSPDGTRESKEDIYRIKRKKY